MEIKVLDIIDDSIVDGEGLRKTVFISGCDKNCKGCHNHNSWIVENGKEISIEKLTDSLISSPIHNITISGGDPLSYQYQEVYQLVKNIKEKSNKNIWVYTGMTWEEIFKEQNQIKIDLLKYIDVLVDGRFELENRDITLAFRGSTNQKIIDVKESLKQNKIILYTK